MENKTTHIGILLLRLGSGGMMFFAHGLPKLLSFHEKMEGFPDPIGIGSMASLSLTVFAEFLCALAIVVGWRTRLAAVPLFITMMVAAWVIHADDPWQNKEFPLLYATFFLALLLTGGGKYSLDALFGRR